MASGSEMWYSTRHLWNVMLNLVLRLISNKIGQKIDIICLWDLNHT